MPNTQRVMVAFVSLQQNGQQRANKSNDRCLGMVPPFARGLGARVALCITSIKLGDLCISPHSIPQHQIVPTNLRTIPNMIKYPLPSVEVLEANGTMHMVSEVVSPNGFHLMDFKHVNSKFLTGVSLEVAFSSIALESHRLFGRTGPIRAGRGNKGISISKFGELFNMTNETLSITLYYRRPVLEVGLSKTRILH